ncbi:MAG TPA: chemotaxis protein CheW [Candidatus Polarisedimenticolaceae bacterium]|nr:chemotaxis protein CheW [Candidatus Polarisedimenticolaceae bacterium]
MSLPAPALRFELAGRSYALPLDAVDGLSEPGKLHRVPGAPPEVPGLCEWRGRLLAVIDLARLLEAGPAAGPACLIRLAAPFERSALLVGSVVRLAPAAHPPEAELRWIDPAQLLAALERRLDGASR